MAPDRARSPSLKGPPAVGQGAEPVPQIGAVPGALVVAGQLPGEAPGVAVRRLFLTPPKGVGGHLRLHVLGVAAGQIGDGQGEAFAGEQGGVPHRAHVGHHGTEALGGKLLAHGTQQGLGRQSPQLGQGGGLGGLLPGGPEGVFVFHHPVPGKEHRIIPGAAGHDGFGDQALGGPGTTQHLDAVGAGALAHHRDVVGVAAESGNVVVYPL